MQVKIISNFKIRRKGLEKTNGFSGAEGVKVGLEWLFERGGKNATDF